MITLDYTAVLSGDGAEFNTFPLSTSQERLWLLYQLDPTDPGYHMCGAARIRGRLEVNRLGDAFSALCERHEPLRTVFRSLGEDAVQVVMAKPQSALDVRSVEEHDLTAAIAAEARRPFDLRVAPARMTCLRLGADNHVLIVTVHHIVCDGVSVDILVRELSALYGGGPPLEPLPIQFADFALWERRQLAEGRFDDDLQWWRDALAGVPTKLNLPDEAGQGTHLLAVPAPIADAVISLAAAEGTTPFVVVLAAFAHALGVKAGQTELLVGTPVAGRPSRETEQLVGMFVNMLALPIRLAGRGSLRETVRSLSGVVGQALGHANVPFDRIVSALGASGSGTHAPLVEALLAFRQGGDLGALALAGTVVDELPVDVGAPKFRISLDVRQAPGDWPARLEYAGIAPETAAELARQVLEVLGSDCDRACTIDVAETPVTRSAVEPPRDGRGPIDELETAIADAFKAVLGVPFVGRTDDFFALGGHSLLGARLLSRIRERTGADLPLLALFDEPTVAAMASRIGNARKTTRYPIAPAPAGPAVLSSYQRARWFAQQLDPTSTSYNVAGALHVDATIDERALFAALRTVVARQPALRTTFGMVDERPVGVVGDGTVEIECRRLGDVEPAALDAALRSATESLARRPFDLERDLPLRALWVDGGRGGRGLALCTTHAAFDGSYDVFRAELEQAYAAELGLADAAPAPPVDYASYAAWQQARLPDVIRTQLPYWVQRLASGAEPLELPADRPRPPIRTGAGATRTFEIEPLLAGRIRALARSEGVTVNIVLFCAWTVLLHRMSGQERFAVGCPVQVRPAEAEQLIGPFVNPLVICADMSGAPTVREAIARTRATMLDAHEHAELPFDVLVELLGTAPDLSRTPLFGSMFTYVDAPAAPRLGLTDTRFAEWSASGARYDTLWALHDLPDGGLAGFVEYATDLFDGATVERLVRSFEAALTAATLEPELPIDALPLLAPAERQRLLVDWNDTRREVADELPLHQRFERSVDRSPAAPAIAFQETTLTYAELERRANRWAHLLVELGVRQGDRVGFWADRCAESVELLLAILKTGAAYVPFDSSWPPRRVQRVAQQLGLATILHQQRFAAELSAIDAPQLRHRVVIDAPQTARRLESLPATRLPVRSSPDDCAYVLFTSGSTGEPKGVVVRHRPVANVIDWVNRTFSVNADDRLLFVTSYGFDLSVYDLFGILDAGGSIRVAETADLHDPARLWSLLLSDGITFWDSAPATLVQLSPFLEAQRRDPQAPLRLVFLSGDWIPLALPNQIRRSFPAAEVVSLGGATEAVIWSNFHVIEEIAPHWRSIPYGRPIQNARYYVLDPRLEPCPIGVAGDLYIGGPVLADGYTDAAATAERFVPDPHAGRPGAVMYRTGDRARFWADGTIEFLGRSDGQVKVRGHRIERGEIEAVLGTHHGVVSCLVLPRPDGNGDHRLIAWYVPRDGATVTTTDLRAHIAANVPSYMVPAAFVELSAIPMTVNGKVDADRLPDPLGARPALEPTFVAPRDALEQVVARVWSTVLGIDGVGVRDNFFDLGGNSAAMVRVQAALQHTLERPIPIIDLFHHTTVEELAGHLAEGSGAVRPGPDDDLDSRRLLARRNRLRRNRLRAGNQ